MCEFIRLLEAVGTDFRADGIRTELELEQVHVRIELRHECFPCVKVFFTDEENRPSPGAGERVFRIVIQVQPGSDDIAERIRDMEHVGKRYAGVIPRVCHVLYIRTALGS